MDALRFGYEVMDRLARRVLRRTPNWREAMARPPATDLSAVRRALDPDRIRYGLMGGAATRLYQPERTVNDVDLLVAADQMDEAERALEGGGFRREGGSWRPAGEGKLVDLVRGDAPWAAEALAGARDNLDGQGLPILPLPYLVLTKIGTARRKNRFDMTRMIGIAEQRRGAGVIAELRRVVGRHRPDMRRELEQLIWLGRIELFERR